MEPILKLTFNELPVDVYGDTITPMFLLEDMSKLLELDCIIELPAYERCLIKRNIPHFTIHGPSDEEFHLLTFSGVTEMGLHTLIASSTSDCNQKFAEWIFAEITDMRRRELKEKNKQIKKLTRENK